MRRLFPLFVAVSLLSYGADSKKAPKQQEVKIQKSSISKEKEIQMGKEAAAEVEREMQVVQNPEVEAWLNAIGAQLAKTPQANAYPYHFQLVNDESINAFALPGGPMFVHTGLIKAADNEAQVAGVLAHEMSHVALRHGVSQMGKSNTWQTILGVAGAASGMVGGNVGSIVGTAVNQGGQLGVGALLSKYSRNAERDADLNGARMLAAAGYDPMEMARFFEKLKGEEGSRPKGMEAWFSSHPAPERRTETIAQDITFYPAKQYTADSGKFASIKQSVGTMPVPKMKPAMALQPVQSQPRQGLPQGFTDLRTKDFVVAYPNTWQTGQQGDSLFIIPKGGANESKDGGVELIAGAMVGYYSGPNVPEDLEAATKALMQALAPGDPQMKIGATTPVTVGGKKALVTQMTTRTSYEKDPEQLVQMYSVSRPAGLWTLTFAFPKSLAAEADKVSAQMLQTIAFTD
jgi:Zn-dependent protease with chaperone function